MSHFLAGISAATVQRRISQIETSSRTGGRPRERGLICFKFLHIALLDERRIAKLRRTTFVYLRLIYL